MPLVLGWIAFTATVNQPLFKIITNIYLSCKWVSTIYNAFMGKTVSDKKRHGCLLAYLIFLLIANATGGLLFLATEHPFGFTSWSWKAFGVLHLIQLISISAVFRWKKWGFWFFAICTFTYGSIHLFSKAGTSFNFVIGLIGISIFFGVLHIGGEKKGWSQLD